MTPALAEKIKSLVAAGATVVGPKPTTSPSLQDFPHCDVAVAKIGTAVWGDCDGKESTAHRFGKGKVVCGQPLGKVLANMQGQPDFSSGATLNWIHRQADGAEIYFVANPSAVGVETKCQFRVNDLSPELWQPETGAMEPLAVYEATGDGITIPLHFGPSESLFVVFRKQAAKSDPVVSFTRDGQAVFAVTEPAVIEIQKATYGVPGDAQRTRDVRAKLQELVARGVTDFSVAEMAQGDDPAYGVVKTLNVEYTAGGHALKMSGQDTDNLNLASAQTAPERAAQVRCDAQGRWICIARQPGRYEIKTAGGQTRSVEIGQVPAPVEITGAWDIRFPPKWGAPEKLTMEQLGSWTDSTDVGVKYFSGTAAYRKTFDWTPEAGRGESKRETWLDLGDVQGMAQVKLNGRDLGVLWKTPFRVEITSALRPGSNTLEIRVANLWPNRMIGDVPLAQNDRFTWSSYEPFKKDTPLLKSGLLGPVQIVSLVKAGF
jgi:hypothetical protein